ncbi:MAG: hypothetical protein CR976_02130 [Thiotrichales bacterium]|nr:MAG: hypothetical protein CR976_02130 [Thiotrichales bacterium]
MDVSYSLNGIRFIWDGNKAQLNLQKHDGVTFEYAAQAFFDPFIRVVDASRNDEARDAIIGMANDLSLLYVVHIQIEDDQIRIISARKATRTERKHYED